MRFLKKIRRSIFVLIFLVMMTWMLAYFFAERHHLTAGFSLSKISSSLTPRPEWEVAPLNSEEHEALNEILNQKFTYLGKGMQCWAFASEDGNYVLKFFYHQHLRVPRWLNSFPMRYLYKEERLKKKHARKKLLERTFASYKIAFEQLREETGLIFVHLNKTDSLRTKVTLIDKMGRRYHLDMDNKEFLIQKRARMILPTIDELMLQGDDDGAKHLLTQLVALLVERCNKGIGDQDPHLERNGGFINDQAILIDVGQFEINESLKDPLKCREELFRVLQSGLISRLEQYPELIQHIDNEIQRLTTNN